MWATLLRGGEGLMWNPSDLGHVIEGLPSVAHSPLLALLRAAFEKLIAKSSVGAAKQQEEAANQISAAAKKQNRAAKQLSKAAKRQARVVRETADLLAHQHRAVREMGELVEELRGQVAVSVRQAGATYDPLRGALEVWNRERKPLSLDEVYHAQQLGQLRQLYSLLRACEMSPESALERLSAAIDVSDWDNQRESGITLQRIKHLSQEQQEFDRHVANFFDEALDGAPGGERQRLERIVSSVSQIVQCAKASAAEPTILVLPAVAALAPEFRDAFSKALEQVTRGIEGAHHRPAEKHEDTPVEGRRSPRMLVATDVLKAGVVLDPNIVRRLHKVMAPFTVICVQPRYAGAALRIETWSWLRGDMEPTAFARTISITREEAQLLDVRPEWLLAAFTSWLTVLIGSTLSALGFEGVTLLSILRPKTYSRPERLAFSKVANDVGEWLREACGDRYGELGLAEEVGGEIEESRESLASEVGRALRSAKWESCDFASTEGVLWVTITKPFTNFAYLLALPESRQKPLCVRCWRIRVSQLDQAAAARRTTLTTRPAVEITLERVDASFPDRIKERMDAIDE